MTLPLGGFAIPHFAFHPIDEDLSMGTPGCEVWGTRALGTVYGQLRTDNWQLWADSLTRWLAIMKVCLLLLLLLIWPRPRVRLPR
jgi:hypothetical protein